jgi:hypothetical protein
MTVTERKVLRNVLFWAESRCPCENEQPNPCTLCGASVENLEPCKSAERTLPLSLLRDMREAISSIATPASAPEALSDEDIDAIQREYMQGPSCDVRRFARMIERAALAAPSTPAATEPDEIYGLKRYLNDVLSAGTANERTVARTALRMIATPPYADLDALDMTRLRNGDCRMLNPENQPVADLLTAARAAS